MQLSKQNKALKNSPKKFIWLDGWINKLTSSNQKQYKERSDKNTFPYCDDNFKAKKTLKHVLLFFVDSLTSWNANFHCLNLFLHTFSNLITTEFPIHSWCWWWLVLILVATSSVTLCQYFHIYSPLHKQIYIVGWPQYWAQCNRG